MKILTQGPCKKMDKQDTVHTFRAVIIQLKMCFRVWGCTPLGWKSRWSWVIKKGSSFICRGCIVQYWRHPGGGAMPTSVSKVTRCSILLSALLKRCSYRRLLPYSILSHSHGGQRKREWHGRSGEQLGHPDVVVRFKFGKTEHSHFTVSSGGADEPPGLATTRK